MKLTLGPVLFNWEADAWRDFYFRIADEAAVDAVAVGEVVCSKRMPFFDHHFPAVIERLTRAGKEVLVSSLALVTLERERKHTEALAQAGEWLVEANDVSCIAHLVGRPHVIGPFVNVYNEGTARWFAAQGAQRICLPAELPLKSIAAIAATRNMKNSCSAKAAISRQPNQRRTGFTWLRRSRAARQAPGRSAAARRARSGRLRRPAPPACRDRRAAPRHARAPIP